MENKEDLIKLVNALIDKEMPIVSNLANISSILFHLIPGTSWAGFYLYNLKKSCLYLNCFQGEVACYQIPYGKGVCGKAIELKESIIVPNVLEFPGHIACSNLSRSEIVVPILNKDTIIGVIDLDSNQYNNFTDEQRIELEGIAKLITILFEND